MLKTPLQRAGKASAACWNHSRSVLESLTQRAGISVCRLLMAVQSLLMAIRRLRMCIQSLQTEIFCLLRRKYKPIVQAISAYCLRNQTALRETAHAFRAKKKHIPLHHPRRFSIFATYIQLKLLAAMRIIPTFWTAKGSPHLSPTDECIRSRRPCCGHQAASV